MLNYIKADFYRLATKPSAWIWTLLLFFVPPFMIVGAGTQYEPEKIMSVVPTCIYLTFILVALMLNESVFGEEKRLGLYKNDTTSGISRTRLFLAKFLTGALLEIGLWLICSAGCVGALVYVAGAEQFLKCIGVMFSLQSVQWLLMIVFYTAVFQTIRVLVNKPSMLILVYGLISTAFTQVTDLIKKAIPQIDTLLATGNGVVQTVFMLVLPIMGIAACLGIGSMLFQKSEF